MTFTLKLGSPPEEADYTLYGENLAAARCRDSEVILSGPADTGKTIAMLTKLHACACYHKNASIIILRKKQSDVYSTVLVSFLKKVLHPMTGVRPYGGETPQWLDYPTGTRIWIAGLYGSSSTDISGKVLSGEHDIIYVNQAEELALFEWETLFSRATGRAGNMPYAQLLGDCNPGPPTHWIRTRARSGSLRLFHSTHRDNPELFDQTTGLITPEGERRIGKLKKLTGARLARLYHGLWVAPEGAIYDVFDEEKHKVLHFPIPPIWPKAVGIDPYGAYTAAVWVAFDPSSNILHVYREYYEPFSITTSGHARAILERTRQEAIFAWVGGGPSERQQRVDFAGAGIPLLPPPISDVWVGIDRVNSLLSDFALVIHDTCPQLLSEIGDYRRKLKAGEPTKTIENKEAYHLLDALRYIVAYLTEPQEQDQVIRSPVQIGHRW